MARPPFSSLAMKHILVIALLCGTLTVLLWAFSREGGSGAHRSRTSPSGAARMAPLASVESAGDDPEAGSGVRVAIGAGEGRFCGGIIAHRGDPGLDRGSGTLVAALETGSVATAPFGIPVEEGKWRLEARPQTVLRVYRAEIDGRPCWPVDLSIRLQSGEGNRIELRSEPSLRVIDAVTGQDLPEVFATHAGKGATAGAFPHPGVFGTIPLSGPMPNPIPTTAVQSLGDAFLVTAPGYTWGAGYEPGQVRAHVIGLHASGDLVVRTKWLPSMTPSSCTLVLKGSTKGFQHRLYPDYAVPFATREESYVLEKIRTGRYTAAIVHGFRKNNEQVLYAADIEIRKGQKAVLDAEIPEFREARSQVSVIVVGSPQSLGRVETLRVIPERVRGTEPAGYLWLEADDVRNRYPDAIEYEATAMHPGAYLVEIRPLGYLCRLEVPEEEFCHQEIDVGCLCSYTLRFKDPGGQDCLLGGVQVDASGMDLEALATTRPLGARSWVNVDGSVAFEAPCGNLRVRATRDIFERTQAYYLDGRQDRVFDLVLPGYSELVLRLTLGQEAFVAPTSWWVRFHTFDEEGRQTQCGLALPIPAEDAWNSQGVFKMPAGEDIRLVLPPLVGFSERDEPFEWSLRSSLGRSVYELDVVSGSLMRVR